MGLLINPYRYAAAAGPNVFYYSSAGATPPNLESFWFADDTYLGNFIIVGAAGNVTKMGYYGENQVGSPVNMRISLWWNNAGTWTLHECGVLVLAASSGIVWHDFTLVTPRAAATSEELRVMYVCEDATGSVSWYKGADTGGYRTTRAYASGCSATQPTFTDNNAVGARIFVA